MKLYKILILLFFSITCLGLQAQEATDIPSLLDKYGKQKGSVLVQLSKDVLAKGCELTLYKSLTIDKITNEKQTEIMTAVLPVIEKDWEQLAEVRKGGSVRSGTYHIEAPNNQGAQYLLVKNDDNKLSIVYIKGNIPSDKLGKELKKLRNLFIYVNDKKIKIE